MAQQNSGWLRLNLLVIVNKLHRKKVVGRWSADHLLTTCQPPADHLPSTNHLPTTYWPPTDHFFTVQLVHDYQIWFMISFHFVSYCFPGAKSSSSWWGWGRCRIHRNDRCICANSPSKWYQGLVARTDCKPLEGSMHIFFINTCISFLGSGQLCSSVVLCYPQG